MHFLSIFHSQQNTSRPDRQRWFGKKSLGVLTAFVLCLGGTFGAQAADEKSFPGAMCQTMNKDQVIFRNAQGRMYNASGVAQDWICPVVRDVTNNAAGILDATVVVEDRNAGVGQTFDVRCSLISRTANGVQIASQPQQTNGAPGVATLFYAGVASAVDGYYYFGCHVPATVGQNRSGIISYRVNEN